MKLTSKLLLQQTEYEDLDAEDKSIRKQIEGEENIFSSD